MRILQRNLKRATDIFLFISHTTNVLLFKFRCNIFIGVRIIKEMPGSVASGTSYIKIRFKLRQLKDVHLINLPQSRKHDRVVVKEYLTFVKLEFIDRRNLFNDSVELG